MAHTEPTLCCGWEISKRVVEKVCRSAPSALSAPSSPFTKAKWLFVRFEGGGEKIGCTGWCTLCVRICDWSDRRDSNPRPSAWEANALPTEPLSHNVDIFIAPYGGLLLLNSLRRLLLRECRLLSRCRLLPMRQCCRGWVRDKRSRGILFDRLQRRCCS